MKANRLSILAIFSLTTLLSCSPKIEPMLSTKGPMWEANFVFWGTNKDVDSAYAFLNNDASSWYENRIPLFPKSSESITYLLNGKPTKDRNAIKNAFHNHKVTKVLVGMSAQNNLELVSIQATK
ncbi:hypothetical protein CLV58_12210 [Spirosoma oryzae]|uniref:Uncharacterized protein n=1 Tax=Spirosoma oryzae TaxID=1469603 RepID=A0A2T0SE64_9BACT|nr:hypothetical protein [Spirosoma oryzae]PRY31715.1 hypothetical protein CLV58_12210 [Spirosoma oryzae]